MTDTDLVKGCIKNDRRCQNALYKRYFPLMSGIALRYAGNKDEAIHKLNGGFLKVLQNIDKWDKQFAFATFIRNVMVNHLIDEFRKEKKYLSSIQFSDYSELDGGIELNTGETNLQAVELLELLNRLPEMTAKVFNLFAIDGFKHHEIAIMMGISAGTSKWHVSEARKKLKDILEQIETNEKKRSELA